MLSSSPRVIDGGDWSVTSHWTSSSSHSPRTSFTQASCQRDSNPNGAHGTPASVARSTALRNQRSVSSNSAQSS